jgi:hypothetical protein
MYGRTREIDGVYATKLEVKEKHIADQSYEKKLI